MRKYFRNAYLLKSVLKATSVYYGARFELCHIETLGAGGFFFFRGWLVAEPANNIDFTPGKFKGGMRGSRIATSYKTRTQNVFGMPNMRRCRWEERYGRRILDDLYKNMRSIRLRVESRTSGEKRPRTCNYAILCFSC